MEITELEMNEASEAMHENIVDMIEEALGATKENTKVSWGRYTTFFTFEDAPDAPREARLHYAKGILKFETDAGCPNIMISMLGTEKFAVHCDDGDTCEKYERLAVMLFEVRNKI